MIENRITIDEVNKIDKNLKDLSNSWIEVFDRIQEGAYVKDSRVLSTINKNKTKRLQLKIDKINKEMSGR